MNKERPSGVRRFFGVSAQKGVEGTASRKRKLCKQDESTGLKTSNSDKVELMGVE